MGSDSDTALVSTHAPASPVAEALASAAKNLALQPRGNRWCHLSLCVLDAVFSINATYPTTVRTVRSYATHAELDPVVAPADEVALGTHARTEQPLSEFLTGDGALAPEALATLLGNRQRTSTRSGILKAEATQRYARILVDHGLETLADVADLLIDLDRTADIERALATVPGHGRGVRVSYLWMLAGDDQHVKADRMVTRWVARALNRRSVSVAEAGELLKETARQLNVTPWVLDHAIWNAERQS